ncbi:acetyltransferase [Ruminococcus sp. AF18-22]|nr:acetyltransferase [Ruminococcus sp. AF18-22]
MKQNFFIHETSKVLNVEGADTAKIYKECSVVNSVLQDKVSIGDFSRVSDSNFEEHVTIQRNAMIYSTSMGRYSYTGKNFVSWHSTIGAFCSISWNVSVGGANHDYEKVTTHSFLYAPEYGVCGKKPGYNRFKDACVVGNDVWIAAGASICRGVEIGDGAVVAAGAVVVENVEPYTIVGGVPARPIKKRFEDNIIAILKESEWWNLPIEVIKENFALFNMKPTIESASKIRDLKK